MKKILSRILMALAITAFFGNSYAAVLEEIIVTAQKRTESLQDVPISMSALDGQKLEEVGIHSFQELTAYVPNLSITENAVNTIIGMRGVGIGANQSFEQSVGIYVDGVHYGKSRQVRTGLFDLQQVEVLRGPQGILFGKNTLAGAINISSASPQVGQEMGGKIAISAESFGGQTIEGNFSGSLTDSLALRFAYKDRQGDGHLDNTYPDTEVSKMPTVDESMWRVTALWEPTDDMSVEIKHSESEFLRMGANPLVTLFSPLPNIPASNALMYGTMGAVFPAYAAYINSQPRDAYRDTRSYGGCDLERHMGMSSAICESGGERPEATDTETSDTSVNIEMELPNGYTLTAVAGRGSYFYQDGIDADFLPLRFIGRSDISDYSHNSQELRIASPSENKFSWVAGVYLDKQKQEIDRLVTIDGTFGIPHIMPAIVGLDTFLAYSPAQVAGVNATTPVPGTPFTLQSLYDATGCAVGAPTCQDFRLYPGVEGVTKFQATGTISNWKQNTNSRAVFFQGSLDLSDSVTLTAGVRYTEEEKRAHADAYQTTSSTGLANPNPSPLLAGLNGNFFERWDHNFDEQRSTNQLIPAANLQWTRSEDSKFYLSYSEGFKSGGFNAVDSQAPAFTAAGPQLTVPGLGFEYDDENATSFELGGKHTLLDGAMNLNWAYFNSEYKDQQVSTFVGLGFVVTNAATTDIQGLEIDMTWQATDNIRLGANVAFTDGSYGSFPGAGCTAKQASDLLGLGTLTVDSPITSSGACSAQFRGDGVQAGSGQDLAGAQVGTDYNGSLFVDYVRPMASGLVWFTSIDMNFTDGYFMTGDRDPIDFHEGFQKFNIRTGLRSENWTAMLYGKNITDEETATGAYDIPLAAGSHGQYTSEGVVWGARLSYSF
ncbi:TonB-dependent receptor [Porticoccaceae bacterium]|nr:TonB-dependent receptor [Porticoccaceae bacterium]